MQHAAFVEIQFVVAVGVGRKPVSAINVFAIGFKPRKALFEFRNHLACAFHDLQVFVIHPNAPLEKLAFDFLILQLFQFALVGHDLRRHVEFFPCRHT